jgi:hypothetical protein
MTTVVLLAATLGATRPRITWPATLVFLLIIVVITGGIVIRVLDSPMTSWGRLVFAFTPTAGGFLTCLSGVFLPLRRLGYRLQWRRASVGGFLRNPQT